jgi:hypothetical protein
MTNTVLKAQIDSQITNETTPNGITPTEVGVNIKAVVDYVDQEVSSITPEYKVYRALLTKSASVYTLNVLENTLGFTLVAGINGGSLFITESVSNNFLTVNSIVRVSDTSSNKDVLTKYAIDSLNQIAVITYYQGTENLNFSTGLQVEIYVY